MTQSTFVYSQTLEDYELVCADALSLESTATTAITAKKSVEYIQIKNGYFSECVAEQEYLASIIQIFCHFCPLVTSKHIFSKTSSQCSCSAVFESQITDHGNMYKAITRHLYKDHTCAFQSSTSSL